MIDDRNQYEKTKAWLKANQVSSDIAYLMTIDMPLLPLATLMVYSLRLYQRVRNITTAMGSCISYMMKKEMKYGESNDFVN